MKTLILSSGIWPIADHVKKMKTVRAIKINAAVNTAGLLPLSKTIVQIIFRAFVTPK